MTGSRPRSPAGGSVFLPDTVSSISSYLSTGVASGAGIGGCYAAISSADSRLSVMSRSTGSPRSQRVNWLTIKPAAMLAV